MWHEPATQRISVVNGQYTRTQGLILDDPDKMKHPKAGSKTYVHIKGCPQDVPDEPSAKPAEVEPAAKPAEVEPAAKPAEVEPAELMAGFTLEVPFDEEVLTELSVVLDPANKATYSADFAQGAAWLFNRVLMTRLHKARG